VTVELLRFPFAEGLVSVRDMREEDIETFVSYWHDGIADLEFLGIDRKKLGSRDDTRERFRQLCRRDGRRDIAVGFTFCYDDRVIGFTNVNILGRPKGYVHVHLTDPGMRRRGIISAIFARSLPVIGNHILAEYPIDGLVLETRTRNIGINRVVQRTGLRPRATVHLDNPDGVAGPGEFCIYEVDAALIRAMTRDSAEVSIND
jgi:RimJ/RimL family protein N-acetyltransferase